MAQAEVLAIPANVSGKKKGKKPRNPKVEHVLDQTVLDGLLLLETTTKAGKDIHGRDLTPELKAKVMGRIQVKRARIEFTMQQRFASPKSAETLENLL